MNKAETQELIAKLRSAAWAGPIPCPVCDEAANAIEAFQSGVALLEHKDTLITKFTEDGSLIERLYSAGLQQEKEIFKLTNERDALQTNVREIMRLADAYADACFDQALSGKLRTPIPEKQLEALLAAVSKGKHQ